jgi:hypothetical protein
MNVLNGAPWVSHPSTPDATNREDLGESASSPGQSHADELERRKLSRNQEKGAAYQSFLQAPCGSQNTNPSLVTLAPTPSPDEKGQQSHPMIVDGECATLVEEILEQDPRGAVALDAAMQEIGMGRYQARKFCNRFNIILTTLDSGICLLSQDLGGWLTTSGLSAYH